MFRLIHEKVQAERACTFIRYLRVVEQTLNLGVGPNGRIHIFNLNSWRATFRYVQRILHVVCTYNVHTLHTIKVVSSQNHALKLEFCKAKLYRLNRKPISTSVVSKYSLDRVLTRKFLHFDTRTRSYSSSLHKTSNGWGEFWIVKITSTLKYSKVLDGWILSNY